LHCKPVSGPPGVPRAWLLHNVAGNKPVRWLLYPHFRLRHLGHALGAQQLA